MPKIDWAQAQAAWEGGLSKNQISKTFAVSVSAVTAHQKKEGWQRPEVTTGPTGHTIEPTDIDLSDHPQVALHQEIADLNAEVARLRSDAGKPREAYIPVLNTREDVVAFYGQERLELIAAKQSNRERKRDGFAVIEYEPGDRRLNAAVEETIESIIAAKTAEAGKHNLRTIKMAFPDKRQPGGWRLAALPVEANFNNEKANPGANVRHYTAKGFVMVKPVRCFRGPCWAAAGVDRVSGALAYGGYCSPQHQADDPLATARRIGGVTSSESMRIIPA